MVIHGFDHGVIDMNVGDKKTFNIPCLEAYGEINEDLMIEVPKAELPAELGEPQVGTQLSMVSPEGYEMPVEIVEVKENSILLNGNHPLAGADLIFDVELVEIM